MEVCATLRISNQHIANWLRHGICSRTQVFGAIKKLAVVVVQKNISDGLYQYMAPGFNGSVAFQAACNLVFKGCESPAVISSLCFMLAVRKRKQ